MTLTMRRILCSVVLMHILLAEPTAQTLGWSPTPAGPTARAFHAMAYDSLRGKTVLFGGQVPQLGDTWEWDGSAWTPHLFAASPSPRSGHAMAYDSVRGRTVLFGGSGSAETWEWDGSNWTLVSSSGPSGRSLHAMACDASRGRTVLFGGRDAAGFMTRDTWEWDGVIWLQRANSGPLNRERHAMAGDVGRGRVVLFGGAAGLQFLSDTWEWDGATWTQRTPATTPSGRFGHAMAYDSFRERTVLFGGIAANETWEWDGTSWAVAASGTPSGRSSHAMAYDSQRLRLVLMGGVLSGGGLLGDVWEFHGGQASVAFEYGNGCGNPALTLSTTSLPIINTTASSLLTGIPTTLSSSAFVALGWSNTSIGAFSLPLSLAGYGMPGCSLLQSAEAAAQPVTATSPGSATYGLVLPNWGSLIGLRLYLQGWAFAPFVNPGHTIVSNGVAWVIGNS